MNKVTIVVLSVGFLWACAEDNGPKEVQELHGSSSKVIYGEDGRVDADNSLTDMMPKTDATVALMSADNLTPNSHGGFDLPAETFGESMDLCSEERFFDQINPAHCSGSLVAPNVVLTAGHCVNSEDQCADTKFVFDFKMKNGQNPTSVKSSQVYSCARLIDTVVEFAGADWALIELDRPVTDRQPVQLGNSDTVSTGHPVTVVGFPSGVPMKVTGGGSVRSKNDTHFVASVDTYGGNSGSPVFSDVTGEQVGILVRGERDFSYDREAGCRRSFHCEEDACRGEDLTLINLPKEALQNTDIDIPPTDEPIIDEPIVDDPIFDEPIGAPLFSVRITAVRLNVRLQPDTSNDPCGTYSNGDIIDVYGIDQDTGWYRVNTDSNVPMPALGIFEETCWGRDAYISGNGRYSERIN